MSNYREFLEKQIFKTHYYGQFKILFDMFEHINEIAGSVCILERCFIYGDKSIFANLLSERSINVIDYRPLSADKREGFQSNWIENCDFDFKTSDGLFKESLEGLEVSGNTHESDILVVPNVLHHCRDVPLLVKTLLEKNKSAREIYFFDSYIREGHQEPDDFCRYTVSALDHVMKKNKFHRSWQLEYGNVFDAILYFCLQAEQNFVTFPELVELDDKIKNLIPELLEVRNNEEYRSLGRPNASLITGYSVGYTVA